MANCPKCGEHLRLIDWKQHCPHCGANIVIYDLQERLMQQADEAEVQHYHFSKKVDRVKGAFIGSKLAIARIFTSILPVGPLFLPIIYAKFTAPFDPAEDKFNLMSLKSGFSSLLKAKELFSNGISAVSRDDLLFTVSVICFFLSILLTVLHFALNTLACSPKGKPRNITIDLLLLITTLGSAGTFFFMGDGGSVTGTLQIGAWLYVVLQIANAVVDFMTLHQGIEIKHAQCYVGAIPIEEYFVMVENGATKEEIRAEQYKRLQARYDEKEAKLKEKQAEEEKRKQEEHDARVARLKAAEEAEKAALEKAKNKKGGKK